MVIITVKAQTKDHIKFAGNDLLLNTKQCIIPPLIIFFAHLNILGGQ